MGTHSTAQMCFKSNGFIPSCRALVVASNGPAQLQAAATLLAAVFDVPSFCPRSDGQLATKPCRVSVGTTPPPLLNGKETRQQHSGGEGVEVLAGHDHGATGNCCEAPVLGLIPAMQV